MLDVVGLGSIFVDYFFETEIDYLKKIGFDIENDCLWGSEMEKNQNLFLKELKLKARSLGGMSVNTLMVLSKLGLKCGLTGIIGKDNEGEFVKKTMLGVDLKEIKNGGDTARCFCLVTDGGKDRTFVSYPNEVEDMVINEMKMDYVNKSKFVYLSPFFTKDMMLTFEKLVNLVAKIKKPKLAFTPTTTYVGYGIEKLMPILKKTYVIFLNKKELSLLTESDNLINGGREILKYGPKIVVCTMGEKGAVVITKEESFEVEAIKVNKIVDSTGAGDTFAAGFLWGLLKNKTLEESAKVATILASQSLTGYGEKWMTNEFFDNLEFNR